MAFSNNGGWKIVHIGMLACLLSCSASPGNQCKTSETGTNSPGKLSDVCRRQQSAAVDDYNNGRMKYYFFGMAGPSKQYTQKLKELRIQVVTKGCVMEEQYTCYNAFIDSIMLSKHNIIVSAIK
jgi:hypothetical protein